MDVTPIIGAKTLIPQPPGRLVPRLWLRHSYQRHSVADEHDHRPEENVPAYPGERRGLAHLEALLGEKGFQPFFYVVNFSSSCVPASARADFFFEDFEVAFFRAVFDARLPPFMLPSPPLFAAAFAAAA